LATELEAFNPAISQVVPYESFSAGLVETQSAGVTGEASARSLVWHFVFTIALCGWNRNKVVSVMMTGGLSVCALTLALFRRERG
jgi:hypothetical protein